MKRAVRSLYRWATPDRVRRWLYATRYFWRESAGLTQLARPGPKRVWLATVRTLICVKHELPCAFLCDAPIPVWIEQEGRIVISDWSELLVIGEIYRPPRDYELADLPEHPRVIVDVGANIGLSARFFRSRYPDAEIVACEPDPKSFRMAQRNVRGLNHLSLRNVAVAGRPGQLQMHRVAGESWVTSAFLTDQAVADIFEVNAVTLDSLIEELGAIDVLKIDIEGAEYDVLQASRHLDRIDYIVGEFHPVPGVTPERFFALLDQFELLQNNASHGKGTFLARRRLTR